MRHHTETHARATQGAIAAACFVAAILLALALFGQGCSSWQDTTGRSLAAVHELAKGSSTWVELHYRAKCMKVAKACEASPCEALETCQHERRRVNSAIKAVHAAVRAMTEVLPLIEQARVAGGDK